MNDFEKAAATIQGGYCGCMLLVLIFNLLIGGWSVDYILAYFEKDIPFWGDTLIGLFVAEFSVPVAIVMWLLTYFGVL